MDKFVARENVRRLRRELENGVEPNTRTTMLGLLVEEENLLGYSYEQLARLDRHISRLAEIMARQVQIGDALRANGHPTAQAELIMATYNDLMACYMAHRDRINASLSV